MFTDVVPVADLAAGQMLRQRGIIEPSLPKGFVHYELLRGGKILVPRTLANNGVANAAKLQLLDAWFNGGSDAGANFYIGLVDGATFTQFQATDTALLHTGWQEFTNYTISGNGTNRGTWGKGAASGNAVTNSSPVVYDFTGFAGTKTVHGIFVQTDITKSSTIGLLWSSAAFLADLTVESGDQLRVTYTVQL